MFYNKISTLSFFKRLKCWILDHNFSACQLGHVPTVQSPTPWHKQDILFFSLFSSKFLESQTNLFPLFNFNPQSPPRKKISFPSSFFLKFHDKIKVKKNLFPFFHTTIGLSRSQHVLTRRSCARKCLSVVPMVQTITKLYIDVDKPWLAVQGTFLANEVSCPKCEHTKISLLPCKTVTMTLPELLKSYEEKRGKWIFIKIIYLHFLFRYIASYLKIKVKEKENFWRIVWLL